MELQKELQKVEQLLLGSGLLMEKYQKKVNDLQKEKNQMKSNFDKWKAKMNLSQNEKPNEAKISFLPNEELISKLKIKAFQETLQKVLSDQRNFQKEVEKMRLSNQKQANETVVLQNSLARLSRELKTRSFADRDMQILKREVQRVWNEKKSSDEQRKKKETELMEMAENLKTLEEKLKSSTENLNKANMTLNVYKIILKDQQQKIHHFQEEIKKQAMFIQKQSRHLDCCLNDLESSKMNERQTLMNLEVKNKEENYLKDLLVQKKEENKMLKTNLFLVKEKLSESQHLQELSALKMKWNEKYWDYYQARLEAQDEELRKIKTNQDYSWIKDQSLPLGLSQKDFVICKMDRKIEQTNQILIQNPQSITLRSSFDNTIINQPSRISAQHIYDIKLETLEIELQKKSALLDSLEKYKKELEHHVGHLHQIFLGKFNK